MSSSRPILVLSLVLACGLAPREASADWHIVPFIGLAFGGETNLVDLDQATRKTRLIYGGTGTFITDGPLGLEVDFSYLPKFFEREADVRLVTSSSVTTLTGHVVLAVPRRLTGESLRPYVSGGLGLVRPRIEDLAGVFPVDRNLLGMSVGGGATGFLTDRTGVRWDVRYFRTVKGEEETGSFESGATRLSFWRATMGVVIKY